MLSTAIQKIPLSFQRQIQCGTIRVDEQVGGNVFYWSTSEKEYKLDRESPMLGKVGAQTVFPAELCTMGIPRDPWDFLARAIEVGHPRSLAIHLNEEVTNMLQQNFAGDLHSLVKERAAYLMKWTTRCKELESEEKLLHCSLEPHLQQVLRGKRLLVFQEMLNDLGYLMKTWYKIFAKVLNFRDGYKGRDFFQQRSRDLPMIWTLRRSLQKG